MRWYESLARPLVFQLDPELAHSLAIATVRLIVNSFPMLSRDWHDGIIELIYSFATNLWIFIFTTHLILSAASIKTAWSTGRQES